MIDKMGAIIKEILLREFRDKNKEMFNYSSSNEGMNCQKNTSEAGNKSGLGLFANNDESESPFGGFNNQVETCFMIGLTNAGDMAMARQHGDCNIDRMHTCDKNKGKNFKIIIVMLT